MCARHDFISLKQKVRSRSCAPKNANSDCCYTKLNRLGFYATPLNGICIFAKFKSGIAEKGIVSPKDKNT